MACRTAEATGAVAVLCLAFPLQPPRRSGAAPTPSRLPELDAVTVPTLVVQGARDRFGIPPAGRRRTVVQVPGDHSLRTDLEAVAAAVRGWLPGVVGSRLRTLSDRIPVRGRAPKRPQKGRHGLEARAGGDPRLGRGPREGFYTEKAGFNADHDHKVSDEIRFVQLTPPGSACSIALGTGIVDAAPGSVQGMQLVVSDINAARAELVERGVDVSEVQEFPWGSFVFFSDPDGNGWAVQQLPARETTD